MFIQKNQDIENHLLDILDQFPDNAKIDMKIEEDAVIENTLHAAERLASLYKSILKYTLSIDVPRNEAQQRKIQSVLGLCPPIIARPKLRNIDQFPHFQSSIGQSSLHLLTVVQMLNELKVAMDASSMIIFE